MFVLANMWFQTLMRQFFFNIDKIVFNFISIIYDFLITIARTSILSQADIMDMASRIYKLLAVFMVFKVTFSLIMYVVNPDDFSDKTKGVGKLVTNIIISLSLLILTPYIFNYAYQFQTMILEDNALATLVFGNDTSETNQSYFQSAGDKMAFITMSPFFSPNLGIQSISSQCANLLTVNDGVVNFNDECKTALDGLITDEKFSNQTLTNYVEGVKAKSLGLMFRQDVAIASAEIENGQGEKLQEYIIDYKYLFSTVVGVIVILLLVTFCMDVALRSIKLAFLQLIAPIPIISYVDPKSGKDGLFKKWYQMCFKTFLSLFVRLLALYFAVYIISRVDSMVDIVTGAYVTNALIKIAIVIGALMFAKQLPKILEGLGIKLDGDGKFFLNPLKKFEEQALGGKRITGTAGALVSAAADRGARIMTAPGVKGKLAALAGTGPGLLGAAKRGFSSNAGFKGGMDRQAQFNRRLREGRINGLSPASSYLDYLGSTFGLDDATLEREGTITRRNSDNLEAAKREIADKTRQNELDITAERQKQAPVKSMQSRREAVKKSADKLMDSAEAFASKKADIVRDSATESRIKAQNSVISKLRSGETLTSEDITHLNSMGLNLESSEADLLKKEREINSEKYTTNRRADAANVAFLTNNQGKVLEHDLIVGEGDSQFVVTAGTYIDGSVVAKAQDAQGRYIKASKKAVYDHFVAGDVYSGKEEQTAFDSDYDEYNTAKEVANSEIEAYNASHSTSYSTFDTTSKSFDEADKTSNVVKSGADTSDIGNIMRTSESYIESLTRENEEIKNSQEVVYYDEKGNAHTYTVQEAESYNKQREEAHKRKLRKHQERRSFFQSAANKK